MNKFLSLAILLPLVLMACKSRKTATAVTAVPVVKDTISNTRQITAGDLINPTLSHWTYLSYKADVNFKNGETNMNATAHVRMYKDSLLWVMVQAGALGINIEAMRILANKDSMVILDKINKRYYVYRKAFIENMLGAPLNISELQHLLIGRPVYDPGFYSISRMNETDLNIKNIQPRVFVHHHFRRQFMTIDTTSIDDRTAPHYAKMTYGGYISVSQHNFPLNTLLQAYNGTSQLSVALDAADPDFNTPLTFNFAIPSSYARAN